MLTKEKDEELAMFLDMRRSEKEKDNNDLLLPIESKEPFDHHSETKNHASSPISKMASSTPTRKSRTDQLLDSENDKSDYDWLLTPPGTPSMEMESQKNIPRKDNITYSHPTALKPRLENILAEPASKSKLASKHPTLQSGQLLSSNASNKKPSLSGAWKAANSRPVTPTGQSTVSKTTKPSRSVTPSSRVALPSKTVAPTVRSITPIRSTARSSTPTARPSLSDSKTTSRSAAAVVSAGRSSSQSKSRPRSCSNPRPVKSRSGKPAEMPGLSLDAPTNLKTSFAKRSASASRERPGASNAKSSLESKSNGKPGQPSPELSASLGSKSNSGKLFPSMNRSHSSDNDEVNPVLIGSKMVERVVNMRKLAPPKQDDYASNQSNSAGKSSHADSSGFGRTLSNKSLDMALRHMDIRQRLPAKLRAVVTNIPASLCSVSSATAKTVTVSVSESPLATSSNASSEPSLSNNSIILDGSEIGDNDLEKGIFSPTLAG